MAGTGERAYVYAKACGIIGKSFVGRRIAALRSVSRLSELDRLVFGSLARELPERELLSNLERRLTGRSVAAISAIVNAYKNPPDFLIMLVRVYEYADLKTALALVRESTSEYSGPKPEFTNLGRFGTVHFDAWPNAKAMLGGTEFEFLLDKNGELKKEFDGVSLETVLDRHYYKNLWAGMVKLKKSDRRAAEKICREEISLRNCAWVLRLRTYYGMQGDEVKQYLIRLDENTPGSAGQLCSDALDALELPLDSRSEWEKWKRIRFLNSDRSVSRRVLGGAAWHADPRYFQNAASEYLYKLALHHFRLRPSSIDTCFCFIKLKQFEEDLLTSDAEGLGMSMGGKDVFTMLEKEL